MSRRPGVHLCITAVRWEVKPLKVSQIKKPNSSPNIWWPSPTPLRKCHVSTDCATDDVQRTAFVESESGPCGVNRHWNGSDGGERLLQSLLVPLRQEAVPGAVGGAVRWVVATLLSLKQEDKRVKTDDLHKNLMILRTKSNRNAKKVISSVFLVFMKSAWSTP